MHSIFVLIQIIFIVILPICANEDQNPLDPFISEKLRQDIVFKRDTIGMEYIDNLKIKILVISESKNDNSEKLLINPKVHFLQGKNVIQKIISTLPYEMNVTNPVSNFQLSQTEELVSSIIQNTIDIVLFTVQERGTPSRTQISYISLCIGKRIPFHIISDIRRNTNESIEMLNSKIDESVKSIYITKRLKDEFDNGKKAGIIECHRGEKDINLEIEKCF